MRDRGRFRESSVFREVREGSYIREVREGSYTREVREGSYFREISVFRDGFRDGDLRRIRELRIFDFWDLRDFRYEVIFKISKGFYY